jgi:hypothetical protein
VHDPRLEDSKVLKKMRWYKNDFRDEAKLVEIVAVYNGYPFTKDSKWR